MKGINDKCALSDPENWPCKWALPPDKNNKTHRCPRRCDHYVNKKEYQKRIAEVKGAEITKGGFENCLQYDSPCEHKVEKGEMLLCPSPCDKYETEDRKVVTVQGKAKATATVKADIHQEAFGLTHKKIEQILGLNQAVADMTMARLMAIKKEIETAILMQLKVLEKLNVRVEGIIILRPEVEEGQETRDGFANLQEVKIHLGLS